MARARAEMQPRNSRLSTRASSAWMRLLQLLARPLQQLDAEVENELAAAGAERRQAARPARAQIEPAQVIAIIRESLALLPSGGTRSARAPASGGCRDGARAPRRACQPSAPGRSSRIRRCRAAAVVVARPASQIDARLESRITAIVASALGDERAGAHRDGRHERHHRSIVARAAIWREDLRRRVARRAGDEPPPPSKAPSPAWLD